MGASLCKGAKKVFNFVILVSVMNIDIEDCYKKYAPMVFRRCSFMLKNEDEALDAAQDVFVSLLRHSKRLHGQFLSSLLYTIATNICLNRLRRRKFLENNRALSPSESYKGAYEPGLPPVKLLCCRIRLVFAREAPFSLHIVFMIQPKNTE